MISESRRQRPNWKTIQRTSWPSQYSARSLALTQTANPPFSALSEIGHRDLHQSCVATRPGRASSALGASSFSQL
jgi:hypothetical protein